MRVEEQHHCELNDSNRPVAGFRFDGLEPSPHDQLHHQQSIPRMIAIAWIASNAAGDITPTLGAPRVPAPRHSRSQTCRAAPASRE